MNLKKVCGFVNWIQQDTRTRQKVCGHIRNLPVWWKLRNFLPWWVNASLALKIVQHNIT